MKRLRRYSLGTLVINIIVILWGAYVRATGSGAGCGNHWPLCNGEVIPQSGLSATLIEYTHRVSSGLAFLMVVGLYILVRRAYAVKSPPRQYAAAALVFMIVEALIGAVLVIFELVAYNTSVARAAIGAFHLLNTFLLFIAIILSVAIGAVFIPPATVAQIILGTFSFQTDPGSLSDTMTTIIVQLRLPHTILIAMAGAALAASGAGYQGLFQNPLADPYLIGVASGAGLGAVVAMSISWPDNLLGFFSIPVAAFFGAALTVIIVYRLARFGNVVSTTNLILAGVAVGSFASELTSFIMLRSEGEVRRAIAWLLGGSTISGWPPVLASLPYIALSLGILIASGHALNVLQFGDEQAQQLGLPVERVKIVIILAASLATATAVAFTGVIGFIGLIVPHLVRILYGPDYRHLVSLSIFGGATALLIADLLARTLLAPQEIPIGVITALAGAPFFLWVLRRSQRGVIQV